MKRIKASVLAIAMTTLLAGNIFATDSVASAASLSTSLLNFAITSVLTLIGADDCPLRQCTNCKPNNGNNDGGDCRPTP